MRDHLATLLDDFRKFDRGVAVVRYQGNRRRVTSYGELAQLAGRFAALLERRGIVAGDRVVLWGENSAEWLAGFLGCMLRGVLAVPLDAAGAPDFAARIAVDVQPKLALGDAVLLEQLPGEWPRLTFEEFRAALPAEELGALAGLAKSTPLEILFTSGTTGEPKGVVITHGNVLASIAPVEEGSQPYLRYERLVHPLRILHTLPLSHVFGQTMALWVPHIYGAEVHFESRLAAPHLIDLIHRERISVLASVPRVLALLKTDLEITHPGLTERATAARKLNAWRRWWRFRGIHAEFGLKFWAFVAGGGALPGPLEQFWNGLGFVLVQGYGMTETTALITLNHPFHVSSGTIGKPLAGREVKLGPDGEVLVRGAMISGATWANGAMQQRESEWLATGDIAEREPSGELKFLGRKSEVIVTANGLNVHPEDMEAALEQQPGIAACAVVPMETAAGVEPCAVLALRGDGGQAAAAVESANARLPEFQRIRRWVLYPEPDLPRTSTGKVKRKEVGAWLDRIQKAGAASNGAGAFSAQSDWLLTLIAQISGETPHGVGDELRLTEDLHLDSLGRVQLAAAIEQRLGIFSAGGLLEEVQTLGDLRKLIAGEAAAPADGESARGARRSSTLLREAADDNTSGGQQVVTEAVPPVAPEAAGTGPAQPPPYEPKRTKFVYPTWPWWKPLQWIRAAFLEVIARPLTWLLAAPRVFAPHDLAVSEPVLIIANHVTAYDAPLIQYALDGYMRRHVAVAMRGELLDDFRHARNPNDAPGHKRFYMLGPPAYWLATALFNVFPLPQARDFQTSFAHTGRALDRGYNVMIFPEGARSRSGKLAPFRPGIGILVKQSHTAVLPVALRGIGAMKARGRGWFRSGELEVHVGKPIRFAPQVTEAEITKRLHDEVAKLLGESD